MIDSELIVLSIQYPVLNKGNQNGRFGTINGELHDDGFHDGGRRHGGYRSILPTRYVFSRLWDGGFRVTRAARSALPTLRY